MQKDSNQTAMTVQSVMAINGQSAFAMLTGFDGNGLYGNGMSLYGYLGSNLLAQTDALGLSFAIEAGSVIGAILVALTDQYSFNLSMDSDWAADWSQDDRFFTRTDDAWINYTIAETLYRSSVDFLLGPLDDIAYLAELGIDYFFGRDDIAVAGSLTEPLRLRPIRRFGAAFRHGGKLHRVLIGHQIRKARGYSVPIENMRVDRTIIDPQTGKMFSGKRPDVFGRKSDKRTVVIGECAVSESYGHARRKLDGMIDMLRKAGFTVIDLGVMEKKPM